MLCCDAYNHVIENKKDDVTNSPFHLLEDVLSITPVHLMNSVDVSLCPE
jgi:hypothetical protein